MSRILHIFTVCFRGFLAILVVTNLVDPALQGSLKTSIQEHDFPDYVVRTYKNLGSISTISDDERYVSDSHHNIAYLRYSQTKRGLLTKNLRIEFNQLGRRFNAYSLVDGKWVHRSWFYLNDEEFPISANQEGTLFKTSSGRLFDLMGNRQNPSLSVVPFSNRLFTYSYSKKMLSVYSPNKVLLHTIKDSCIPNNLTRKYTNINYDLTRILCRDPRSNKVRLHVAGSDASIMLGDASYYFQSSRNRIISQWGSGIARHVEIYDSNGLELLSSQGPLINYEVYGDIFAFIKKSNPREIFYLNLVSGQESVIHTPLDVVAVNLEKRVYATIEISIVQSNTKNFYCIVHYYNLDSHIRLFSFPEFWADYSPLWHYFNFISGSLTLVGSFLSSQVVLSPKQPLDFKLLEPLASAPFELPLGSSFKAIDIGKKTYISNGKDLFELNRESDSLSHLAHGIISPDAQHHLEVDSINEKVDFYDSRLKTKLNSISNLRLNELMYSFANAGQLFYLAESKIIRLDLFTGIRTELALPVESSLDYFYVNPTAKIATTVQGHNCAHFDISTKTPRKVYSHEVKLGYKATHRHLVGPFFWEGYTSSDSSKRPYAYVVNIDQLKKTYASQEAYVTANQSLIVDRRRAFYFVRSQNRFGIEMGFNFFNIEKKESSYDVLSFGNGGVTRHKYLESGLREFKGFRRLHKIYGGFNAIDESHFLVFRNDHIQKYNRDFELISTQFLELGSLNYRELAYMQLTAEPKKVLVFDREKIVVFDKDQF